MAGFNRETELTAMELYEKAMDAPSDARQAFITDHPGYTLEVKQRALALAVSEGKSLRSLRTGGAMHLENDDEAIPDQVGAYRILRLLGRGGMGAVYLGERAADDFEHIVAIKVIKSGLLSEQLVERFQRERQILAQLNHPNIAHFYGGGETAAGAPYIIMEYVDGVPLTEWLKQEEPGEQERLKLFRQICDAVAFAHQNLVIHRDLTPGNVLVTQGDQAKLIDFGIARPQMDEEDESKASSFTGLSLTPGFAAPERSSGLATNTLTDIYSLGKLLQLLLDDGTIPEIRSIIDKATRTDPAERYDTVNALIRELRRLEDGRPVLSYSSAPLYQFRKFIGRHKLGALATTAALTALIAAFSITYIQYNNAQTRFTETRELTAFLLNDLPEDVSALPGNLPVLRKITDTSARYLDILAKAAGSDDDVQLDYAMGRLRLGELLTVASGENLGKPEEGIKNFETAIAVLTPLADAPDSPVSVRSALAKAMAGEGFARLYHLGETDHALRLLKSSNKLAEKIVKQEPGNREMRSLNAENDQNIAQAFIYKKIDPHAYLVRSENKFHALYKAYPNDIEAKSQYAGTLYVNGVAESNYWGDTDDGLIKRVYKPRLDAAIQNLNQSEKLLRELVSQFPTDPRYKLQYAKAIRAHIYLATMQKQWEPKRDKLYTDLASSGRTGGRDAVLARISSDPEYRSYRRVRDDLSVKLEISSGYLDELAPYDGQTYSHIEATFYNLRMRADIAQFLAFDMQESLTYTAAAIAMAEAFAKANPDFRNAYIEMADLYTQRARAYRAQAILYGVSKTKESCSALRRAQSLWTKVEKKWGVIEDYAGERRATTVIEKRAGC